MPELPDVTVYREALEARLVGRVIQGATLLSPFVLRTVAPPLRDVVGQTVVRVERIGKRIVIGMEAGQQLVIHLMIGGRLLWKKAGSKPSGKVGLAVFQFEHGALHLVEYATKKRASLHVVADASGLAVFDRGGVDPLTVTIDQVAAALRGRRHTLKRSLTDPTLFDGIGGAYGDEILFEARLGPLAWSDTVDDAGVARLAAAMPAVLTRWTERLRAQAGAGFPERVTAFQPEMAVHGRYGQPCPACAAPVQRIVHADRETNYCARCQNEGRLYRDRALSALLKADWPETLDDLDVLAKW